MMDNPEATKIFRAEKTTQNRDDFKVLMVGSMVTIIMLLVFPLIGKTYDRLWAERPFITATVEIIQTNLYTNPMILYDADATRPVSATWVAIIRDQNNFRIATRRGTGSYSIAGDNAKPWTWESFFDDGLGSVPPEVPKYAFKICVKYFAVTTITNIQDETEETCSGLFLPGQKAIELDVETYR